METEAGLNSGYNDSVYKDSGAEICQNPEEIWQNSDLILKSKRAFKRWGLRSQAKPKKYVLFSYSAACRIYNAGS